MKEATGKYIHFIDGDDWVAPKMLQEEVTLAEKYDLQLVVSGFTIETYFENLGEGEDLEAFLQEKPHLSEEKRTPTRSILLQKPSTKKPINSLTRISSTPPGTSSF